MSSLAVRAERAWQSSFVILMRKRDVHTALFRLQPGTSLLAKREAGAGRCGLPRGFISENLVCNHASLNERPMMLNIGLMRQAVNVNGKAGRASSDRLSLDFPTISMLILRTDSARQ